MYRFVNVRLRKRSFVGVLMDVDLWRVIKIIRLFRKLFSDSGIFRYEIVKVDVLVKLIVGMIFFKRG